jgi:hypothetical protein
MQTGIETFEAKRISKELSPILGKNIFSRGKLGSNIRESRKTNNVIKSNRPHSLKKQEFYNELCVQLKQGSFNVRNNFVSNLYACIKNHPKYNNDLVFTKDMNVNNIVSLMKIEIDRLMPNNAETLIEDINGDLHIQSYCAHDMLCNQVSMPLKWLIQLRNENPKLYVIIRNVISLVKGKFLLNDFQEGFSEDAKEMFFDGLVDCEDKVDFDWNKKGFLESCSANELKDFVHWRPDSNYKIPIKDGIGYLLIEEINDIYKMIDEDWLMNEINTYKPRKSMFIELLEWAKNGMKLYYNHNDVTINDLIFITEDEYESGQPVTACDFLKFEWDFRCPFWEFGIEQWLNDHAGQVGVIETRAYSVLTADHYVDNFDKKYELFGKELEQWFNFGTDIYYREIWNWEKR